MMRAVARGADRGETGLKAAKFLAAASVAALAWLSAPPAAAADGPAGAGEPALLVLGAGVFDMVDPEGRTAEFRVEYAFSDRDRVWWVFKPVLGLAATAEGGAYLYAGNRADIRIGRRLVATPHFAFGLHAAGGGKDLGHAVEFRTGLDLAWRFDDASRLGVTLHHISNAGLSERNPGEESAMLFWAVPLDAVQAILADR